MAVCLCVPVFSPGDRARASDAYEQAVARLRETLDGRRSFTARLAGETLRVDPETPGLSTVADPTPDWRVLEAANRINHLYVARPAVAGARGLAEAFLVLRDGDAAIEILGQARSRYDPDPSLANDLAAAHLSIFEFGGDPYHLVRGLDLLLAVPDTNRIPQTTFNIAIAAQELGLVALAEESWSRVQADAAAAHPPALTRAGLGGELSDSVSQAITRFETVLLGQLAETNGCERATRAANDVASALGSHGELAFRDFVIRLVVQCRHSGRLRDASSLRSYVQARNLYEQDRIAEADAIVRAIPVPSDAYFRDLLMFQWAVMAYWRGDRRRATSLLDEVALTSCATGVTGRYLCARTHWIRALVRSTQGDLAPAMKGYEDARSLFNGLGDAPPAAAMANSIAEILDYLGEDAMAWRERVPSIRILSATDPRRAHNALLMGAEAASRQGMSAAALAFAREAFLLASLGHRAARRLEAGIVMARLDRGRAFDVEVEELSRDAATLPAPEPRERMEAELAAARAEAATGFAPGAADDIRDAMRYFNAKGMRSRDSALLSVRARHELERREMTLARRDIRAAAAILEGTRSGAETGPEAVDLLRTEEELSRLVVMLNAQTTDAELALANLELLSPSAGSLAKSTRDLRSRFGPREYFVQFQAAEGYLDRFIVGRSGVARAALETPTDLRRLVSDLSEGIRRGSVPTPIVDRLSALVLHGLDPTARRIWVVPPNGALSRIPFAALRWPASKTYVAESTEVVLVRGLSDLAALIKTPPATLPEHPSAAIFGPAATLGLPDAIREVTAVASAYGAAAVLGADERSLLEGLRGANVVHIAGHFEPGYRGGSLILRRNERVRLSRLAISAATVPTVASLSACSTATSLDSRFWVGGAAADLLDLGIPFVIASLWPVTDSDASLLMTVFHQRLARNPEAGPVQAFVSAQQSALRAGHVDVAFAFQIYAGVSSRSRSTNRRP